MHPSSRQDRLEINGHVKPTIPPPRVLRVGPFQDEVTRALAARVAEVRGRLVVIDPMPGARALLTGTLAGMLGRLAPRTMAVLRGLVATEIDEHRGQRPGRVDLVVYRAQAGDPRLLACIDPELSEFDVVVWDHESDEGPPSCALDRWSERVRRGGVLVVRGARTALAISALEEWVQDPRLEATWPLGTDLCVVRVGPLRVPRALRLADVVES